MVSASPVEIEIRRNRVTRGKGAVFTRYEAELSPRAQGSHRGPVNAITPVMQLLSACTLSPRYRPALPFSCRGDSVLLAAISLGWVICDRHQIVVITSKGRRAFEGHKRAFAAGLVDDAVFFA